jgi:hypothetical protein
MKTIFDADFEYTPSHSTDIRRTFERVRAEQEAQRDGTIRACYYPDCSCDLGPTCAARPTCRARLQ